jgi:Fe(3+) dicitrate transport protein
MRRSLLVAFLLTGAAFAQDPPPPPPPPKPPAQDQEPGKVTVSAKKEQEPILERLQPPSHVIREDALLLHKYDDIHRVLRLVPGVYMREEDGYGLRPNIGFRGTTTDRSAKVTLMQDGILFGPAPYTAPAAYYFPMSTRMQSVETTTGPGILRYGPLLVGGALNMKTRDIPTEPTANIDVAGGSHGYRKAYVWAGDELWVGDLGVGFLAEGAYIASNGFKDLDGGGNTGFWKMETIAKGAMAKGAIHFGAEGGMPQRLQVKLGYGKERSDETYLGLADADFRDKPNRRYRGSQLDEMNWHRMEVELAHTVELGKSLHLTSAAYYHDFDRVWGKINRFRTGPDLHTLLGNPNAGTNGIFYAVLKGEQDTASAAEDIMIGTNDRSFVSEGIQSELVWSVEDAGKIQQAAQLGVRFHRDRADRRHSEDAYAMTAGKLIFRGDPESVTLDTTSRADALAIHAAYTHRFGPFVVTPRLRAEIIRTDSNNHQTGTDITDDQSILLPGILAAWEIDASWTAHAGVYRGFTPKTPGQTSDIDPEESVNYEAGASFASGETRASATGFFNDYSNLTAEDTFASGGGGTGQQFNGGEVQIYGLELALSHRVGLTEGLKLPAAVSYTYLHSEFMTSFVSANPEFGNVQEGDALPYLPTHQLTATVGLEGQTWQIALLANFVSLQREVAGNGPPAQYDTVPARTIFDFNANWRPWPVAKIYLNIMNLFDREYLVSHRPYGGRPGLPRQFQVGMELRF